MGNYLYKHPNKEKIIEVIQGMNDEHVYFDEDELQWERVWTVPQGSIDSHFNAWSSSDFVEKTRKKKGTVGDIWEKSQELSNKRADEAGGVDPQRKKAYDDYQRKTGKIHPQKREEKWKDKDVIV